MTQAEQEKELKRQRLVEMYSAYPEALEPEVKRVFSQLCDDVDRVVHNVAHARIASLIPTTEGQTLLWKNITQAIITTAAHSTGEKKDAQRTET